MRRNESLGFDAFDRTNYDELGGLSCCCDTACDTARGISSNNYHTVGENLILNDVCTTAFSLPKSYSVNLDGNLCLNGGSFTGDIVRNEAIKDITIFRAFKYSRADFATLRGSIR